MELPAVGQAIVAGKSGQGKDIKLFRFGAGDLSVLLMGGVHGDEPEGFLFAERLIESLQNGETSPPPGVSLYICPRLNPDGCEILRRTNYQNVDLNRNLPTKDWTGEFKNPRYYPGASAGSEPETDMTIRLIESTAAGLVISLHSYEHAMVNFNGDCEDLAKVMGAKNGLPPKGDIGYPTPGSLGTWSGWERNLPTITLEILRDEEPETVWKNHKEAILTGVSYYTQNPLPARKAP